MIIRIKIILTFLESLVNGNIRGSEMEGVVHWKVSASVDLNLFSVDISIEIGEWVLFNLELGFGLTEMMSYYEN